MEIGFVFDEIQEEYSSKMIRWVPYYQALMEQFRSAMPAGFSPTSILDMGSGNGNVTATLIAEYPQARYTLVDASSKMLGEARERFHGLDLTTQQMMMQKASFEPGSFDLVAASFSLHHLPEEEKKCTIQSIYRWLRPGGYFCYADLFVDKKDSDHPAFVNHWKNYVQKNDIGGDWEYLEEHYNLYDHPSNIATQIEWLRQLEFNRLVVTIHEKYWVFILAQK